MITALQLGSTPLITSQWFVTAIRNLAWPGLGVSSVGKGSFAGTKLAISKPQNFRILIEFMLLGTSFADIATQRENFEALLSSILTNPPQTLYITKSNGTQVQVDIKAILLQGDITSDDMQAHPLLVELQTEYPYLKGVTNRVSTLNVYSGGGFAIPMAIPLPMNNGGQNTAILTNNGTVASYPLIVLTGPLTNPQIVNLTNNQTLNLNYNLLAGQIITIDCFNRTAILSPGGNNMRQYLSGDFITLAPGANSINLGSANTNQSGTAQFTFQDHYIGV
jgi:hypothetical protein